MKNVLKSFLAFSFIILLMTGCGKKMQIEDKSSDSTQSDVTINENVLKDQTLEEFQFSNTSIVYENGISRFATKVTNISNESTYVTEFKIHVKLEKENKDESVLVGYIGEQLQAGESRVISAYSVHNLMNASAVEYEIVR